MANKGREYAEGLVGALDRSAYNQQRQVAQNVYNTNWQNVQNQYKNLQDKLKLQQQRANAEYAEGLVDVAENSFNRERQGSANLANRGLSASGITNLFNQADTLQKGEDIKKLLKKSGNVSAESAEQLSKGTTKFANEGADLLGKLADSLGDIGDAETALQNRYNQTLAGIAGAMDQREANNELQAMQRALNRASSRSSSSGKSRELSKLENQLTDFQKRVTINEILANNELTDNQKSNYLSTIFGMSNAGDIINASNRNANATANFNKEYAILKSAADAEAISNREALKETQDWFNRQQKAAQIASNPNRTNWGADYYRDVNTLNNSMNRRLYTPASYANASALENYVNKGITYEDLANLLYGNR